MRKAVLSPLLSALVPGMGQLVNRDLLKGAVLVAAMSLLFIILLGFGLHQFSRAMVAAQDAGAGYGDFAAVGAQMRAQGYTWFLVLGGLLAALWTFAVIDAYQGGRRRDAQAKEND
jgi:hypothetical protein